MIDDDTVRVSRATLEKLSHQIDDYADTVADDPRACALGTYPLETVRDELDALATSDAVQTTPDPWRCTCAAFSLGPGAHESYCGQADDDYPVLEMQR